MQHSIGGITRHISLSEVVKAFVPKEGGYIRIVHALKKSTSPSNE